MKSKAGFTLVEVMIVAGVMSIIVVGILSALVNWQRSWSINEVQMDVQFQARRAMSRMTNELIQTSQSRVNINVTNDIISFNLPNNDYAGGAFTWEIKFNIL